VKELATHIDAHAVEKLMLEGDLGKLSAEQRVQFYKAKCEHVGLDPTALPFQYIRLQGKLTLYASKGCAEQLRKKHNVSISDLRYEVLEDIFVVTCKASTPEGRSDEDCGAVSIGGLSKDQLANAKLKAITKAKRRVTLSLLGLGMLDETEVETIPSAQTMTPLQLEQEETTAPAKQVKPLLTMDDIKPMQVISHRDVVVNDIDELQAGDRTFWKVMLLTASIKDWQVPTPHSFFVMEEEIAAEFEDHMERGRRIDFDIVCQENSRGQKVFNFQDWHSIDAKPVK
jgi:hypothetical protein